MSRSITRLRLDAALYAPAPERRPGQRGRTRLKGERLPALIEVTFEEARAHLGVQTQRQWSSKAIARTTPCLLALYSLVTLAAQQLFSTRQLYRRCAAWYPKPQATFCDTIACVRGDLWSHAYFSTSHDEVDVVKIPRPLVDRFIDSLCYAA
jgi:hypothetical protein